MDSEKKKLKSRKLKFGNDRRQGMAFCTTSLFKSEFYRFVYYFPLTEAGAVSFCAGRLSHGGEGCLAAFV